MCPMFIMSTVRPNGSILSLCLIKYSSGHSADGSYGRANTCFTSRGSNAFAISIDPTSPAFRKAGPSCLFAEQSSIRG